jgi:Fic family protein
VLAACNLLGQWVFNDKITQLSVQNIKEFNRLVLEGLPLNEGVVPGEIRPHAVTVGRYLGAPAEDCEYLLERFCTWLNEMTTATGQDRTLFGILKAIYAHVYFAWIHPFADGNGRTARLIEFQILLSSGVPTAAAHLLSNHYNLTRTEYYRQLERTSAREHGIDDFIGYALQGFIDGLREQLNVIRSQQLIAHWRDYVYDYFRDKDTVTARRQRRLVLDMTEKYEEGPLPLDAIRHVSTRIAEAYAGKTDKTVQRDLESLVKAGLLKRIKKGFQANLELMLAFQPNAMPPTPPTAK